MVAVVTLPLGTNWIELVVSDGLLSDTNRCCVEVITTAQATERLLAAIEGGVVRDQPLVATLAATLASIDRSNPTAAMNQLQAFQQQVLAQVAPIDPALANQFIQLAQDIIEILSSDSRAHGKIANLTRHPNGAVTVQFSASTGATYIIETSEDLDRWDKVGVASEVSAGAFEFSDPRAQGASTRFYRIVLP
jgi:hypothetical protein